MATQITSILHWRNLTMAHPVTTITIANQKIVPFMNALNDGTIEGYINECAEVMHGGNTLPVLKQLIENCQSKQCMQSGKAINSMQVADQKAHEAFYAFLRKLRDDHPAFNASGRVIGNKAKWAYTCEELEAITDAEEMRKIVNCMADFKSKKLPDVTDQAMRDTFIEAYAYSRDRLKELRDAAKSVESVLGDDLLSKLASGKKTALSADEAKALYEFLASQK